MASNYRMRYGVDLVFCIDATMSMYPILDTVKRHALNFYQDFVQVMEAKNKKVQQLRVRIVAFRDYYYDKENAMMVTDFFNLPEMAQEFESCIRVIEADGGGDDPEDGLEALAYAMRSKWSHDAEKLRHVIVVWSDEGTHDLGFGKQVPNYPKNMAQDFQELSRWWGSPNAPGVMDEKAKRLLLFTPEVESWNKIATNWNNVIRYPSAAGDGLRDYDYIQILNAISNTV